MVQYEFLYSDNENEADGGINILDLNIGMTKQQVFNVITTKPQLESMEANFEVYRVSTKITSNVTNFQQYFLYFKFGKLIEINKGGSLPDILNYSIFNFYLNISR